MDLGGSLNVFNCIVILRSKQNLETFWETDKYSIVKLLFKQFSI